MSTTKVKKRVKELTLTVADRLILSNAIFSSAARVYDDKAEGLTAEALYSLNKALSAIHYDRIREFKDKLLADNASEEEVEVDDAILDEKAKYRLGKLDYLFIKACLKKMRLIEIPIQDIRRICVLFDKFSLSHVLESQRAEQFTDDEEWENE